MSFVVRVKTKIIDINVNAATMCRSFKVASELRVNKIDLTDHQTSEDSCLIQTGFAASGKGC